MHIYSQVIILPICNSAVVYGWDSEIIKAHQKYLQPHMNTLFTSVVQKLERYSGRCISSEATGKL
ncbi:MAG: hypothetical protein A3F68_06515 [Acidobacteria bacterium RIFCSPLOWO2_12_FULL_54_10]|nr:MAG: hypothetical protein A3F68_06515 [Acidobacteria bacterium RIFCSPLOWO2_12_FULL_54_10]